MGPRTVDSQFRCLFGVVTGTYISETGIWLTQKDTGVLLQGPALVHLLRSRETISACPHLHRDGATDGPTV